MADLAVTMVKLMLFIATLGICVPLRAADRPNILCITSEDNAWNWLGCYGNKDARTPRLDALSTEGFLFEHAYSNAPVCAVARSTIINGVHARWGAILEGMSMADFDRTFHHPEQKRDMTLRTTLGMYAWHGNHHLEHLRIILAHAD